MAGRKLQAPRGTFDVLPEGGRARVSLFNLCQARLGAGGFGPAETPIFEDAELFARGVGEGTEIVEKEMFTFQDQAGRSLALRPEGTAGICRAYVEQGMHKRAQPVRLWYWGPFFRHEAPQAGRYRQFTQVGAETIGSDDPSVDAELVLLLEGLLREAGARGLRLRLSSLGTAPTRREYVEELRAYLRRHEAELSQDVRARIDANPLRAFDSADPGTRVVLREAPKLLDRLAPEDAAHFGEVRSLLDDAGVAYDVDPVLVRGLDYYTRTVFEFESDALGAQSGVAGGGRYDDLIERLGGPPTPAAGWAAGVERILLAAGRAEDPAPSPTVYVAREESADGRTAFALWRDLRDAGLAVEMEQAGRSLKGQLRHADRIGARWVTIVGDRAVELKDMKTGEQRAVAGADEIARLAAAEQQPS